MQGTITMDNDTDQQAMLAVQKLIGETEVSTNGTKLEVDLSQKTLCISVHFRRFGVERKIATDAVTVDMDKTRLRAGKKILIAEELDEITALDQRVTKYLRSRSLSSPLQAGWYLIPLELVEEVDTELQNFKSQREALIEKLIAVYPKRIFESREALKSQYNPGDYPPAPMLRHIFQMQIEYHEAVADMGRLATVSEAIWRRENKRRSEKLETMAEEVHAGLKVGLFRMLKHLSERLGYIGEGKEKKKKFHDTTVSGLVDFLSVFDKLNVMKDQDMAALAQQSRDLIQGVKTDDLANVLRKDNTIRDQVRAGMEAITKQMEPMMVDMPKRFFDL